MNELTTRAQQVATRNRKADLTELRGDKAAIEGQFAKDKNDLNDLHREAERIRIMIAAQELKVNETRARLQARIRQVTELEMEESHG